MAVSIAFLSPRLSPKRGSLGGDGVGWGQRLCSLPLREGARGRGDRPSSLGRTLSTMKTDQTPIALARHLRRAQTGAERAVWARLRNRQLEGARFRRQQPIGPYLVDFVCFEKRLIVEIDGGQHNEEGAAVRDEHRTTWLRGRGFEVIRFWNNEVMADLEAVVEKIRQALGASSPSP